jgi:hypothetical protein
MHLASLSQHLNFLGLVVDCDSRRNEQTTHHLCICLDLKQFIQPEYARHKRRCVAALLPSLSLRPRISQKLKGLSCRSEYIIITQGGLLTLWTVVWKVTPLFAQWISSPSNFLFTNGLLSSSSNVLELGAGVSGIGKQIPALPHHIKENACMAHLLYYKCTSSRRRSSLNATRTFSSHTPYRKE